jgi:hypothetical protein
MWYQVRYFYEVNRPDSHSLLHGTDNSVSNTMHVYVPWNTVHSWGFHFVHYGFDDDVFQVHGAPFGAKLWSTCKGVMCLRSSLCVSGVA